MSDEDLAELQHGLLEARQRSKAVVERLANADLLSPQRHSEVDKTLAEYFVHDVSSSQTPRQLRHAYIEALNLESEELEELYQLGLVNEYTFLDLRTRLRRKRDGWAAVQGDEKSIDAGLQSNPFETLERIALRWMRERNALAWILARFQRARLSQGVQRDIATILCAESVITNLPLRPGLESPDIATVVTHYQQTLEQKRKLLVEIRREFPVFFESLEARLSQAAALNSARNYVEQSYHHGDICAKAFARIDQVLNLAVAELPTIKNPEPGLDAAGLIERVPLFGGLSHDVLSELAEQTRTVTFLSGDEVIGQNEKGNALYTLVQGVVKVSRTQNSTPIEIGQLSQGDFFGEAALLGDDVRTATITAVTPLNLLRLSRRKVLALAEKHPEIRQKLNAANLDRAT
jgi:CPA1 family monovalent cation:H+ antiporter